MDTSLTTAEFEKGLTRKGIIATKHLADTLNECYAEFWNRDKQEILDSMNGNLAATLERFGANKVLGYAVNSQLANTDIDTRVIVVMPTGYSFNGTEFIYTAPIVESLAPIQNEV
tara:strand:- start:1041 stop:1385 length:345 start_codon:yes stop_codon:yes gene_type:complete